MSQALYLASTLDNGNTGKPYDPAEAMRWQATQVSAISITNFAGRIAIGKSPSTPSSLPFHSLTPLPRSDIRSPKTHPLPPALRKPSHRVPPPPLLPDRHCLCISSLQPPVCQHDAGICTR